MTSRSVTAIALLVVSNAFWTNAWSLNDNDAQINVQKEMLQQVQASSDETVRLDAWIIRLGLLQAAIFALQLIAFWYQGRKLNETVKVARQQSTDMQASIGHAARGAAAMEQLAEAMLTNTQTATNLLALQRDVFRKQLRAYVSPQFQGYVPENRQTNNRHEVRVVIKNFGNTPAHSISVASRLRVLPFPPTPQSDFTFRTAVHESRGHLSQHDSFYVRQWLEGFLTEEENVAIRKQSGLGLYIFGRISYKDIFGDSLHTDFCYVITWDSNNNAIWMSIAGRNDAT